jgi:hypothetical protein
MCRSKDTRRRAPLEEQRTIARRHAAKRVTGGIGRKIRLGLDDSSGHGARAQLPHHDLAEQKARQRHRVARNRGALQRHHRTLCGCRRSPPRGFGQFVDGNLSRREHPDYCDAELTIQALFDRAIRRGADRSHGQFSGRIGGRQGFVSAGRGGGRNGAAARLGQRHADGSVAPLANAAHSAGTQQHRDLWIRDGMDEFVFLFVLESDSARHRRGPGIHGSSGARDGGIASCARFSLDRAGCARTSRVAALGLRVQTAGAGRDPLRARRREFAGPCTYGSGRRRERCTAAAPPHSVR